MNKMAKFFGFACVGIYFIMLAYSFIVVGFVKTVPLIFAGTQIFIVFALHKGQKTIIEMKKNCNFNDSSKKVKT